LTRDAVPEPTETIGSQRRLTVGEAFSPRHNSFNFIRLAFCLTVIFSHAVPLGGFGDEWILGGRITMGNLAVYGFFCLSGFLIAGSATRNRTGRYLWQRFLRIMPAYWLCLIVTAFIIGALAWIHQTHPSSCSITSCYYTIGHDGPFSYVYHNFLLGVNQYNIGTTPFGGPVPFFWNNSVWTLLPEVCCYLFLAALASLKLLHRRHVVAGLACGLWLVEVVIAWRGPANVVHSFGPFVLNPSLVLGVISLGPAFLAGAVLFLYRDKVPDSGWLALGFVGVFVAGSCVPFFGENQARFSHFLPGSTSVMAPALAYPLIWLGIHLPSLFRRVGARNDYSYGVYIYGWPVLQLLGIWGVQRWGYAAYTATAIAGSVALAILSWHLVEKRALSLKKVDPRSILSLRTRRLVVPSTAVVRERATDPHRGESEV
jgi:peptidoglycan/LPS O-acetylase OafA/YrhL